jgi:hypothetical protein
MWKYYSYKLLIFTLQRVVLHVSQVFDSLFTIHYSLVKYLTT